MSGGQAKGQYNSSITRVRPVFQRLFRKDPTGEQWLAPLLLLATEQVAYATRLAKHPGLLDPKLLQPRTYPDRILKSYGRSEIELESCFEKPLPPPERFLQWLLEHSDQMTWPEEGASPLGDETKRKRERLFGRHNPQEAVSVREDALEELDFSGASNSTRKWWAFEGFTEVDCYLETDRLVLLIEGKRTEPISSATRWYPARDQLLRNLEVAQVQAGSKKFAVMVLAEETIAPISKETIEQSLPHFTQGERDELMTHYLGSVRWQDLCAATGIPFESLPATVEDVVKKW